MPMKNTIAIAATLVSLTSYSQNTFPYPQSSSVGIGTTNIDGYKLTASSPLYYEIVPATDGEPGVRNGIIPFRILGERPSAEEHSQYMDYNTNILFEARTHSFGSSISTSTRVFSMKDDGAIRLGSISNSSAITFQYSIAADRSIYSSTNILAQSRIGVGTTNPQASLDVRGNTTINDNKLYLRPAGDANHYLSWSGDEASFFAEQSADGPLLVGYSGGVLGTSNGEERVVLKWNELGRVGINDVNPSANLSISADQLNDDALVVKNAINSSIDFKVKGNGHLYAREVQVQLGAFPDYVFSSNYELLSFDALRSYINTNNHLPGISSAEEIDQDGIGLGELSRIQMEKIEELTLYILKLEERISHLENK